MNICVYGASSNNIDQKFKDDVYSLGRYIASNGHTLVYGGGTNGLMGAVMQGVASLNGKSIGVAPKFFDHDDILCKNCTEFIFTDTMRERKKIMEDCSNAFIMVPGGIGTYEEFFEILTLRQLGQHSKPIGILNTLGYYDDLLNLLETTSQKGFMRDDISSCYVVSDSPEELINMLENM